MQGGTAQSAAAPCTLIPAPPPPVTTTSCQAADQHLQTNCVTLNARLEQLPMTVGAQHGCAAASRAAPRPEPGGWPNARDAAETASTAETACLFVFRPAAAFPRRGIRSGLRGLPLQPNARLLRPDRCQ
jgi:hypothetical protein